MKRLFASTWTKTILGVAWLGVLAVFSAWMFCRLSLTTAGARLDSDSQSTALTKPKVAIVMHFLHIKGVNRPTVIEFFDFQCPPCRAAWQYVRDHIATDPQVRYVPLCFPLSIHPYAFGAAVAFRRLASIEPELEAESQIFEAKSLNRVDLAEICKKRGLASPFNGKIGEQAKLAVKNELQLALDLHLSGTPTFILLQPDGSGQIIRNLKLIPGTPTL